MVTQSEKGYASIISGVIVGALVYIVESNIELSPLETAITIGSFVIVIAWFGMNSK